METPDLEIKRLRVMIDGRAVLADVTFAVARGETTVIAGASGAGKSVLLKSIIGLQDFHGGQIRVLGREISGFGKAEWAGLRRQVGMVFQGNALFDSLPVWRNVGFALLYRRAMPEREIRDRAGEILRLVGLEGISDRYPSELSGGMQKRVALARTLINEPRVILYDEPTVGLDPTTSESIEDLLLEIQGKLGTTSLVVTHDQHFTFRVANRVGLLQEGKISFFGPPAEVANDGNPAVRSFFRREGPSRPAGGAGR